MSTVSKVRRVWNQTRSRGYRRGRDWDDDGAGGVDVTPGSILEQDQLAGDSLRYERTSYNDSPTVADAHLAIDLSFCGLRKLAAPDTAWGSGTAVDIYLDPIHVNEHGEDSQSNFTFRASALDAGAQSLSKGHYCALRLGLKNRQSGSAVARYEWRGMVTARDWAVDPTTGERYFSYSVGDFSELVRRADVSAVPRRAQSELTVYPGDTGDMPPQTQLGGVAAYYLSDLLRAVMPDGCDFALNAPDIIIERLPEDGDGLDLLTYVLRATGYVMHWELNRLVIQQHEHTGDQISIVLTDDHVWEVKREMGRRRSAVDKVTIERPEYGEDTGPIPPDRDQPPSNGSGADVLPGEEATEDARGEELGGDVEVYRVRGVWTPPERYVYQEPGDIMFAFSDSRYNVSGQPSVWLANLLNFTPGNVSIKPPVKYTEAMVNGPNGLDWYFCIPPIQSFVAQANLYTVEVYVVSRDGYYTSSNAISQTARPIAGAVVTLRGLNTGVVLGPGITNAGGYAKFDTGGTRDRWIISAYVPDDTYLANKDDEFTAGHPFDDDPQNDLLGPSNLEEVADTWELADTEISFSVFYKTGRPDRDGSQDGTDGLYESYKGHGLMSFGGGSNGDRVLDLADLDIDPANVTTETQGALLAEKEIDRSEELLEVLVVSGPFRGEATAVGRTFAVDISADGGFESDVRTMSREIRCDGIGIYESCSTAADKFFNEMDKSFARRNRVENALVKLAKNNKTIFDRLREMSDTNPDTGELGF